MNIPKRLFFLCAALTAVGLEIACSDDPKIVYVEADGGSLIPDDPDGGASCEPVAVATSPAFAPQALDQGECTDAQIEAVLEGCAFTSTSREACDKAKADFPACASCIIGSVTSPESHPLFQYSEETVAIVSVGACMVAVSKNDEQKACAQAFGQIETCAYAACLTSCLRSSDDDAFAANFSACRERAPGRTCTLGLDAFNTQTCSAHYDSTTYNFCTNGKNPDGSEMTNRQFFTAISKAFCGGALPDAGPDARDR